MIKVRKSLSLLIIVLMILSNLVFAQYAGSYEGKPIESSGEGSEYYREGDVVVYPSKGSGSREEQMMERFMKGELSEDKMRAMAKAASGERFDEMGFQKSMLELKERMQRKEAFSYENEAFKGKYDTGPSYEGYSKEHRVFGMIFEHIGDDIDPREIKQYCNDPEKIADMLVNKLKEKVGELQNICGRAREEEARCAEIAKKGCSQIGIPFVREDATEIEKIQSVAYSCPVNKDAIVHACRLRAKLNMEQRIQHAAESCEKRFDFEGDRLIRECEKFKQYQTCDREKFMSQCMGGIKKENFEKPCPEYAIPSCGENQKIRDKKDARGCILYYCVNIETNACPTASAPQCAEGSALQKKVDDKGCVYYYCSEPKCLEVSKPICNNDERLEAYYDNAGCVTSHQCIKRQTCPEVSKPICGEGASLTIKYDDKGCIVGYECISVTASESFTSVTGGAVLNTYDDFMMHCENSWKEQERICSNMQGRCDQGVYIEKCKEQEKKNYDDFVSKIDQHCATETTSQISAAEQRCGRMDEDRQRCLEQSTKRCGQMEGMTQQCNEAITEGNLRRFLTEEARKRCRFSNIIQDEEGIRKADKVEIILAVLNTATEDDLQKLGLFVDGLHEELKLQDTTVYKGTIDPNRFGDVKLLPFVVNAKISPVTSSERSRDVKTKIVTRQRVEESAGKLASLRDSGLPDEYIYIIEDKASEVLSVSDNLEDIEKKENQKGIGYKIRLFLGLAKSAEQAEISQLADSKEKLKNSIEALTSLIDEVPSDVAKAVLKEQVEDLKKQQEDIEVLIEVKEKKAKGLFGVFG